MGTARALWLRVRLLFRRSQLEAEIDEELRFHMEMAAESARRDGASADEAQRIARWRLGPPDRVREETRAATGFPRAETLWRDLVLAGRRLRLAPGFTAAAVLTLAIGIGASTAIFAVVDAVLLRALPYPEPERLVAVWEQQDGERGAVAPANVRDYRVPAFESLSWWHSDEKDLAGGGTPEALFGQAVGADYFAVLGMGPVLGRPFLPEEDREGGERVVVLTDSLWRARFGADPSLVGRTIRLDRDSYRVVGILPPEFVAPGALGSLRPVEYFVPAAFPAAVLENRGDHETNLVGRLRPGASVADARAQLAAVSQRLARDYRDTNRATSAHAGPLDRDVTRHVRGSLLLLLGAVAAVLAIACLNVANLQVVRALGRQRELAISSALGADRRRLAGGLLVESVLLAVAGGLAGTLLAAWLLEMLKALAPVETPRLAAASLDARVLAFGLAASLATGVLFGLLPAWHASRARPAELLRAGEGLQASHSVLRWRGLLLSAEVALALLLLVGATLLVRSVARLNAVELGFDTRDVLVAQVKLPRVRYERPEQRLAFFQELERRLAARPGVEAVAFANRLPLRGGWGTGIFTDRMAESAPPAEAEAQAVSPGYFRTLAIPLLRGRTLEPGDRDGSLHVAVVNDEFARRLYPGEEALGRRFRRGTDEPWMSIVGIVGSLHRHGPAGERRPQIYLPAAQTQLYPVPLGEVAVRAQADPTQLAGLLRAEVAALDPEQPISRVATLEDALARGLAPRRFGLALLGAFATLALVLTLVGIYGVAAYSVAQRTPELGIRLALGAARGRILRLVVQDVLGRVAAGLVVGLGLSLALTGGLRALLFEVAPGDPGTLAVATLLLGVAALVAAVPPALRATRIDPARALRCE